MKAMQFLFIVCCALMGITMHAQEKVKCAEAFIAFERSIDAGEHEGAIATLEVLRKDCKGLNEKMYEYGEMLIRTKLEASASAEETGRLVNDLSELYAEYDTYFPQSGASVKKAMLLYGQKMVTETELYDLLDTAFTNKKSGFTDFSAIETYFLLYLKKFQAPDNGITQEQLIQKYAGLISQVRYAQDKIVRQRDELTKKQESEPLTALDKSFLRGSEGIIDALSATKENLDALGSKNFTCDKLSDYYAGIYEAHQTDTAWLEDMINTLISSKCHKAQVLQDGAGALYKLKATSQSAFYLASLAQRKNDIKGAGKYFEEAAQLEPNQKKKAELYDRIAMLYRNSDLATAKAYILKSVDVNPKSGRPYLVLAEMYASPGKDCKLTAFEQKALVWLAIETVKKAEAAEARYKATVASLVQNYSKRLPTKADVAAAGKKKGDVIPYGCWINEKVTIPNLK